MPRQGIMLCYPYDEDRFVRKWGGTALIQPKYNGERCRAVFNSEGKVTLLSSEMHVVQGVPHLIKQLQGMKLRNLELDGELYTHHMALNDIHSIASRKANLAPNYEDLDYVLFDVVEPKKIEDRLVTLQHLKPLLPKSVTIAPTTLIHSVQEVQDFVCKVYDQGYEGAVLKQLGQDYERKRSTTWMKLKPRECDVYLIRGTKEEIAENGKPKGALGAFICQVSGEQLFSVGSGPLLTRDGRIMLWQLRDELPGMYLQIKYQGITTANGVPYFTAAQAVLTKEQADAWLNTEEEED